MSVELTQRFISQYDTLPAAIQRKVDKALHLLGADFRHPGLKTHPVQSAPGVFEASMDDKYRMTYERRGTNLVMRNVDNHDECLKNP